MKKMLVGVLVVAMILFTLIIFQDEDQKRPGRKDSMTETSVYSGGIATDVVVQPPKKIWRVAPGTEVRTLDDPFGITNDPAVIEELSALPNGVARVDMYRSDGVGVLRPLTDADYDTNHLIVLVSGSGRERRVIPAAVYEDRKSDEFFFLYPGDSKWRVVPRKSVTKEIEKGL